LDVSGGKNNKDFLADSVILLLLASNILSETINMDGTDMKYLRILQTILCIKVYLDAIDSNIRWL
jgi:hypothetical protein